MSREEEIKQAIKKAIQQFDNGNLSENALNLFQVLGYNTERQSPLDKPNYAAFKESFIDIQSKFNEEKAMVKEWSYVDLLFQLSREEVSRQLSLFDTKQVDRTVIETYLFFTIELVKEQYSRTEISHITREVNRLFPMPVMILFKHGLSLTLSVINRRLHKRDDSKDVLEKVTLIKDIRISPAGGGVHRTGVENVAGTHRAHIEILFDLSFDELKNKHGFTNFVELHNAWQKTLDTKELNKRFFQDLANWYFWAKDYVEFPDDLEKKKDVRNATNLIRLITRVVFIWFIKEKDLVPDIFFNKNYLTKILNDFNKNEKSDTYYNAILQNLFFGTLNQKMGERGFAKEGSFAEHKNEYGVKNLFRYADKFTLKEKEVLELFKDIPFLNGGLFDCLDKPNEEGKIVYVDGFSRNNKKQARAPDFLFFSDEREVDLNEIFGTKNKKYKIKGLINLLDSYKFTVAENTPIEEEIALDPELLGKVFENLLASYNPETQTTARKQTGSFYTPREIVNYMVDESLIAYLSQAVIASRSETEAKQSAKSDKIATSSENPRNDVEERLRELLSYSENPNPFNVRETDALIKAIDNGKILDPACGSGAFPMGILHKLVHILLKLDKDNEQWKSLQRKKAVEETEEAFKMGNKDEREQRLIEINDVFENNASDYGRKLYLIENCIYGIDIQPIAVQIAKLRFFISLIIDERKQSGKDNFGIRSLPNLETKFIAANTLIELNKPATGQLALKNPKIKTLEDELKQLRHDYFNARTRKEKLQCQKRDKELRQQIAKLLVNDGWDNSTAQQIVQFDPYDQNATATFFDPEWMFGLKEGFDVVIGNPPYGVSFSKEEKALMKGLFPESQFKIDSYSLFILKSIELAKKNGICTYIITNTLLDNYFEEKVRKQLLNSTVIYEINDLDDKVFETAVVHTMIFSFIKSSNKNYNIRVNTSNNLYENYFEIPVSHFLNQEKFTFAIREFENQEIFQRIYYDSPTLKNVLDLRQTIKTGNDEIYILSKKLKGNHKPILRGKDVFRWKSKFPNLYVDYGNHLACPRDYRIFEQPKILIREAGSKITATIDNDNYYIMSSLYNGILIDKSFSLNYLLALINSSLFQFLMNKITFEKTKGAFTKAKIYHYNKLPVRRANHLIQNIFNNAVNLTLNSSNGNEFLTFLERLIDAMVYELYLPEEVIAADANVLCHLQDLPDIQPLVEKGETEKVLKTVEKVYKELSNPNHPVSVAMQRMQEIAEIKIIEGKN